MGAQPRLCTPRAPEPSCPVASWACPGCDRGCRRVAERSSSGGVRTGWVWGWTPANQPLQGQGLELKGGSDSFLLRKFLAAGAASPAAGPSQHGPAPRRGRRGCSARCQLGRNRQDKRGEASYTSRAPQGTLDWSRARAQQPVRREEPHVLPRAPSSQPSAVDRSLQPRATFQQLCRAGGEERCVFIVGWTHPQHQLHTRRMEDSVPRAWLRDTHHHPALLPLLGAAELCPGCSPRGFAACRQSSARPELIFEAKQITLTIVFRKRYQMLRVHSLFNLLPLMSQSH